jgi:hypothetical protein
MDPCGNGTYEESECSSTTARKCPACPEEFFCVGGIEKTQCTMPCVNGTYETAPCTNITDRECEQCPNSSFCINGIATVCIDPCVNGTYEKSECSSTTARECPACPEEFFCIGGIEKTQCTHPCFDGTYQTEPCTNVTNRECEPCPNSSFCIGGLGYEACFPAQCEIREFEAVACTNKTNRNCQNCSHPEANFTWLFPTGCPFACDKGLMLQGLTVCIGVPPSLPLYESTIALGVAAPPIDVCENVDAYVSEFCFGLSASNPANTFLCTPATINGIQCPDGVCPCDVVANLTLARRLLADTTQLVVAADSVASDIAMPAAPPPWLQSAAVLSVTGGPPQTASPALSLGPIIGGAAGGVVFLVAAGFATYKWCTRKHDASKKTDSQPEAKSAIDWRMRPEDVNGGVTKRVGPK